MMAKFEGWRKVSWRTGFTLLGLGLMCLGMTPTSAVATTVEGRLSATGYFYEPLKSELNPDPQTVMPMVNRLSLNVRDIGDSPWSAYLFGALRGEALDAGFSSLKSHLYRGWVKFEPSRAIKATAGRMWIGGGVGSALVDGAQFSWRSRFGRLNVFGGTRGYLNPMGDTLDGWDDSGIVAGQYTTPPLWDRLTVGISAASLKWSGETESERLGLMMNLYLPHRMQFFYENRYESLRKYAYYQQARLSGRFATGSASLLWNRREGYPAAYEASYIFQRFQSEPWFPVAMFRPSQEVRGHLSLAPPSWKRWRMDFHLAQIYPEEASRGDGWDISAANSWLRVGYRGRRGYGGNEDALYISLSYQLTREARLWADLNRVDYKYEFDSLPEMHTPDQLAVATRLGADYSLSNGWWFSGVLEMLDSPASKYEVRGLARVIYRFHHETQAKEVR